MEMLFLYTMIVSLIAVFIIDTFQKRRNDLKSNQSK